jgi:hypothetical protein
VKQKSKVQLIPTPEHRMNLFNLCSLGQPDTSKTNDKDVLSAMKFDTKGELLSVGDKDGRVIIFERILNKDSELDFDYLTEF